MSTLIKNATFIVLLAISTSCLGQDNKNTIKIVTAQSTSVDTAFIPADSNQLYFPLEIFQDTSSPPENDSFIVKWYSKQLFAMREPVFYADKSPKEIYRFTWLRTFHNPVAIRIEKTSDTYLLYWKQCSGAGGYDPGKLMIDKYKVVDKATWDEFQTLLGQIDFWNVKTNETSNGTDGAQWILEGRKGDQYHVIDRWTPNKQSKYYQCCDFLLRLTDLEIKRLNKY